MYEYRSGTRFGTRELIDQMALEMEKKAEECEALRSELARVNSLLREAEGDVVTLRQECGAAKRNLAAAQEERARIVSILGLDDLDATASASVSKYVPESTRPQAVTDSCGVRAETDSSLSEYASATLERMRELNRTLPKI